jgi:hypothetical protein
MPNGDPRKSITNGLMYLNKILHTSPYLQAHQFFIDSYLASTKINEHVKTTFNYTGSTDNIKRLVIKVYEGLLKWEIQVKEAADQNHQQRVVNTIVPQAGQGGHAIMGQTGGSQSGLSQASPGQAVRGPAALAQAALTQAPLSGQATHGGHTTLGCQATLSDRATIDGQATLGGCVGGQALPATLGTQLVSAGMGNQASGGQAVMGALGFGGSQASMGRQAVMNSQAFMGGQAVMGGQPGLGGRVVPATQRSQAGQAGRVDHYEVLGIRSLEMGGSVIGWDVGFENKLTAVLAQFELGFTNAGDIYQLAEESDEDGEQGMFV